ncbi:DUF2484 family protein [Rhodobacterales bacterium HKCCE4037]|nr:DUF2484 family protein [Rhodobacterales bacterium HKCCE4037]
MSPALILASVWVLASAITAMLPYRMQFPPGIALLVLAVPLLVYIGVSHGFVWVGLFLFAVGSMFRNPLIYFVKRLTGRAV